MKWKLFFSGDDGAIQFSLSIPSGASMKVHTELKKDDDHHFVYETLTSSATVVAWSDIDNTKIPVIRC
ncbi:MAG: hypothetical protein JNL32_03780 [Candidatus Kapabacteria bacterium]|nr:hypothetical protein [Candidatus Kapabacteria bacterium]